MSALGLGDSRISEEAIASFGRTKSLLVRRGCEEAVLTVLLLMAPLLMAPLLDPIVLQN